MPSHKYTDAEKAFMEQYVPGHSYREIQKAFIEKFGWDITINQIRAYIGNHNLNTGRTGYFEKGHVPDNKGMKMPAEVYEKAKNTMFKKGHAPNNYRPVGSERINKDGYIEIKIKDPKTWMLKHRFVWQQAHGEIPKDSVIIFKDGDKQNVALDNLILVKKSINAVLNQTGLYKNTGETKETAIKIAELRKELTKAKKRRRHG